jgi:hypothetical protein
MSNGISEEEESLTGWFAEHELRWWGFDRQRDSARHEGRGAVAAVVVTAAVVAGQ